MIRKTLLVATCMAIMFATGALASNGTQIGTVGARSTAMGSNFVGLADDWSAVFFNPAGLTQLEGTTIGFSGGLIAPRGSHDAYPYATNPFPGMITTSVDATKKNFFVPAFGVFFKMGESVTAGLGFYAPFGLGTEWDLIDLPADYGNATGISKDNEHFSDHMVINVQPTIAFKLSDAISFGLGASYIWGKMDLDQVKLLTNPLLAPMEVAPGTFVPRWTAMQLQFAGQGITLPDLTATQARLAVENNLTGHGSGFGFNFGFLFELSEKFSFGLSSRWASDLKFKGNVTQTGLLHGDATKAGIINAVPDAAFASAEDPAGTATKQGILALFSGQDNVIYDDEGAEVDFPLPMIISAGFAYKASDRFTLTADVSMSRWSTWDELIINLDNGDEISMLLEWENTFQVGLGFEWMAGDNFFIRGGYYTADNPAPDHTMSPTMLDPNRRHTITGGFGFNFGKVALNACFEYVLFGEKDITTYNVPADSETGIPENYAGKYNFNAMVITIGSMITL